MVLADDENLMTRPLLTTMLGAEHGVGCIVADLATHHQPAVAAAVVLVVEDDPDIGNLLTDFLTGEGYVVRVLRSWGVESAPETLGRLRTDCVLLDGDARGDYTRSWADAAAMTAT